MLPVPPQDNADVDSVSGASSSAKTVHSPNSQRKVSRDNETSTTKVFVRVRPFNAGERRQSGSGDPPAIVTVSDDNPCYITALDPNKNYLPKATYVFDRCFNSAVMKPAAGDDAQLLLPDGVDGAASAAISLSTLEDVCAEALLNPLQLDCLSRDQAAVYDYVGRPVLMSALAGYNGCVFAYGQTGSGKTYTMMGPPGTFGAVTNSAAAAGGLGASSVPSRRFRRAVTSYVGAQGTAEDANSLEDAGDSRFHSYSSMTPRTNTTRTAQRVPRLVDPLPPDNDFNTPRGGKALKVSTTGVSSAKGGNEDVEGDECLQGIVPRLVRDLFDELYLKREQDSSHSFRVEVEYYEIYREKVLDLLSSHPASTNTELRVRQSKTSGPYVENLKKKHVEDERQVFRLLRQGNMRRHTASTAMNDRSSRSHAIFVLHLVQMHITDQDSTSAKVTSKVNLVDLAGSERTGAHNAEGCQFKEGVVINVSLTVLGRVIDALADQSQGKRNVFCPYRDSVLTWLLMDSLGGNSKTSMVATVSPHCTNFEEACQTLRYASRAKQIVTKVVVNEDPQVRQIKLLTAEVQRLKALLVAEGKAAENDEDIEALQDRIHVLEEELNETRNELEEKAAELYNLQALRRITSSLPSTLKAGNAGSAGTAKELSKAKSDIRRLEAENLLHLQTEEELHRSLERIKTLEAKYTQLLTELKDAQESAKKLERDKQERDRRIVDLQQQLFQERMRTEAAQADDSFNTVSPGGASAHSSATHSTTPVTPAASLAGVAATVPSPSEKVACRKLTTTGRCVGKKKAKSRTAAAEAAEAAEMKWAAEKADLCARFDEEKKLLSLQVQERTDAFRRSQLDVKKLKAELKSTQETLQVLEKRLDGHDADVMRRLQDEVQDLRRTLKDERKLNKDFRQIMAGPIEKRPAFSFTYVFDALMKCELTSREEVAANEAVTRTFVEQAIRIFGAEAERATRMTAAHTAEVEALQLEAAEHREALAKLQSQKHELQVAHATLTGVIEKSVASASSLKAELKDPLTVKEEAADAHCNKITPAEEQVDAFLKLTAEQQCVAAAEEKRKAELSKEVAHLRSQLHQEKERSSETAADHVPQLTKASALEAAATATTATVAAHAQQLTQLETKYEAQLSQVKMEKGKALKQIQSTEEELQHEKYTRSAETPHSSNLAKEHTNSLAEARAQLERDAQESIIATELHDARRIALEEQLTKQNTESAEKLEEVQPRAGELQQTPDARIADSDSAVQYLKAQLDMCVDLAQSEEARQSLIQRFLQQTAVYEEQLMGVLEEIASAKQAKSAAANEYAVTIGKVTAELLTQREQNGEIIASLSDQIAELQTKFTKLAETRQAEMLRNAEESAAQRTALDNLRNELQKQKAHCDNLVKTHAAEVQKLQDEGARKENAFKSNAENLTDQLRALQTELQMANARQLQITTELTEQLEASRAELQRSEEAHKHQIERSLQQSLEHSKAMEEVRAQLGTTQSNTTAVCAVLEQRVHELEKALDVQQMEAAWTAANLQRQLEEVQSTLQRKQESSIRTIVSLETTLSQVREELHKSEESRTTQIQRSLQQAAEHSEKEQELNARLTVADEATLEYLKAQAKEVSALHSELKTKEADAAEQLSVLTAQLKAQEDHARKQLSEKEAQLTAAAEALEKARADLSTSEQERKAFIEKSVKEAKEHDDSLATLQRQIQKTQDDAAAAASVHAKQLEDVECRLVHKTKIADATTEDLHRQLDIQRQASAKEATEHARATKALQNQLAAAQRETQEIAEARKTDQERFAAQFVEHAEALKRMQAQLAEAAQNKAMSAAAHEAAVEQMQSEWTKAEAELMATTRKLQEELQKTQLDLARSEQAREEQAEAHTKSLESLQRMLETNHTQQITALKKSHADYVASLEALLASQASAAQSLQDDLIDARSQVKQLVETQKYLGKQLEEEKKKAAELRLRADKTEKARAASTAESVQLQKELRATTATAQKLTEETAQLTQQLQKAHTTVDEMQQLLAEQRSVAFDLDQSRQQNATELQTAHTTIDSLRGEVVALQAEKAALLKAQKELAEEQGRQLVTQQVDTVTELEAQFRAMENERHAVEAEARQTEEALRAKIEKQAQDLRQMREDLDFYMSMNHFELGEARRGNTTGAAGQGAGVNNNNGGAAGGPAFPVGGGGASKTVKSSSLSSRSASPAVGSSVTGGVAGMLSSFFRRGTTGAITAPIATSSTSTSQQVQGHGSALRTRVGSNTNNGSGESCTGTTTAVRRSGNFYTTTSHQSAAVSPFGGLEATGSGVPTTPAATNPDTQSSSNASINNYVVEPTSLDSPSASHTSNSILPLQ